MSLPNNDTLRRPMDQIPANQQSSEQTILLNAIRNKFANNENHYGTSPPIFSIPSLKLPQFFAGSSFEDGKTQSKLNQFILGQLSESKNSTNSKDFTIPNLQIPNKLNGTTPTLAEKLHLNSTLSEGNINSLNKGISELRVSDESRVHVIDLTTALNRQSTSDSPGRKPALAAPNPIDFQIPFIDCDLRDTTLRLPSRDEYCQTDVSNFVNRRFISAPSTFGKITCLRYRLPKKTLCVDHSFKAKHEIVRFGFDTKSPDDVILASLRKYNKVCVH